LVTPLRHPLSLSASTKKTKGLTADFPRKYLYVRNTINQTILIVAEKPIDLAFVMTIEASSAGDHMAHNRPLSR
jgi:hypothetical protein